MLAEGLRAGPNENSMQTLRQRFYSAVIMPLLWQMKTSVAGRENNEVIKNGRVTVRGRCRRHLPAVIPLAGGEGEGSPAKMTVRLWLDCRVAPFG